MSRAAPKDQSARSHAVDDGGSVLVQAPAGSGKTTLLTQRYLRLLASADGPERILALTFTRKAADEMRKRVVDALGTAALSECPPGFNADTWTLAAAARNHLRSLAIDLEQHPSRLRIETIDSFNAWLAAQLPIASGAGGRLDLLDHPRPSYEEAARRALAHAAPDPFAGAVERALAVGDQRWFQLSQMVANMLGTRDRWLPLLAGRLGVTAVLDEAQLARVRAHFDEDLALLVTRALKDAAGALGAEAMSALPPLMRSAARRASSERPELGVWLREGPALRAEASDIERWRTLASLLLTQKDVFRARVNRSHGFPPGCAELGPMNDLLDELRRSTVAADALAGVRALPDPRYDDDDWNRVRDAAQVLVLSAAELDEVFREQGSVDFPAVSLAALRALGEEESPTDLGLRLDFQLQHLLLDEFQDTSGAQLELVRMLTAGWQRGDGRSVFCVGDPMQSIYGFRQAEVRAFLELAEQGIGDVRFDVQRLSSNFRSVPALVEWINGCFERIMPRTDDRQRGAIAFRPSDPEVEAGAGAGGAQAVTLRRFASASAEAEAAAELIAARRISHPSWRIAVLVRARAHARDIALALRSRAIAFRAVDIEPLQDRAVVRDLVMLVCALLHLGDRTAWLAILRAPWAGLELRDLLIIARAGPIVWEALGEQEVLARLSSGGAVRCRRLKGVLDEAFRVRSHTDLPRWMERTWLALGGAACAADERGLAHVRTVLGRLRDLTERGLPDPAELRARFADLYADGGAEDAVEIMTIHKAKGLEFDLVIVTALERHARSGASPLLLTHQFARTEREGMVMAARPAAGEGVNRLFEFLRTRAKHADRLEAQRLLYVACTRAKSELHLYAANASREDPDAAPGENADEPADTRGPRAGSLLAVLWESVGGQFIEETRTSAAAEPSALRGGPLRRMPADWEPARPSEALPAAILTATDMREGAPVFDWAGETARRVGSLVHAELQVMNLDIHDEAAIRARGSHFRRWLALNGVPAERLAEAAERVIAALCAVRGDPRGRWILKQGYRDDFREHAVSGECRGEIMRAVFDRSFVDEQGVRWVIDYKTSRHSGGGLAEFLDREAERYRPQLERYAELARRLGPEPVRVGLYFPLIRAWRELDLGDFG